MFLWLSAKVLSLQRVKNSGNNLSTCFLSMVVLCVQLLYGLVCCARCGSDLTWFAGGAISIPRVTLLEIDVMLLVALSKVPFMVNLIIKLSLKKLFLQ